MLRVVCRQRVSGMLVALLACPLAGVHYWDDALASAPVDPGTVETSRRNGEAADSAGSWHGQCGQDYVVASTFGGVSNRYFVDLAANDPVILSNTRSLERDFGWRGICIDANPSLLRQLAKRRKCDVVGAAISDSSDTRIKFHFGVSAGSRDHHTLGRIVSGNAGAAEEPVSAGTTALLLRPATLPSLLMARGAPATIDFLSLDVEGHENAALLPLLAGNKTLFLALVIERPSSTLQDALLRHRYTCALSRIGAYGDQLWLHQSFPGGVAAAAARAEAAAAAWRRRVKFKSNTNGVDGAKLPAPGSYLRATAGTPASA